MNAQGNIYDAWAAEYGGIEIAGEIVDEICALQRRLRTLQQMLETTEDVAADHQHQLCLHVSKVIVDSCGPRDNGELTYRCLKCGKVF